jgi:beta-aspartyl-dipeptidase (metallo-type)
MKLTLITDVDTYAPEPLGQCDILLDSQCIIALVPANSEPGLRAFDKRYCQTLDGNNHIAIPGLVDSLVHISGGGGEGGYHTRTPQMRLTDATLAGVTTVVGALGTDAVTRTLSDMLAKAKALNHYGLNAFIHTGSYHLPAVTITGDISADLVHIDEIIGLGEVAICDHRGAQLDYAQLAKAAASTRVGGMLAGKGGTVSIHVGDGASRLDLLHEVVARTDIPASQFYPTHMNRNQVLLDAGIEWCRQGGVIDMTTSTNAHFIAQGEIPAAAAIAYCLAEGIGTHHLTMSSDGNASLPVFDDAGVLIGLEVGQVSSLHDAFVALVQTHQVPLQDALAVVTASPADALRLGHKGRLRNGSDADVVLLDKASLAVCEVFSRGQHMVSKGRAIVAEEF